MSLCKRRDACRELERIGEASLASSNRGLQNSISGAGRLRIDGVGMNHLGLTDGTISAVLDALGFDVEIGCLREMIADWVAGSNREMRAALEWQFLKGSKYYRPLTVFSCYRAIHNGPIPQQIMNSTLVIEFFTMSR